MRHLELRRCARDRAGQLALLLDGEQRAALLEEARRLGGKLVAAAISRASAPDRAARAW